MASITIQAGHKNLIFAAEVAHQTGATFEEDDQWIIISDSPTLTIPYNAFYDAFDPDGQRGGNRLRSVWRSLLLNKRGYLVRFDDHEIVITDDPPSEKRPATLLRWSTQRDKDEAERWAGRLQMSLNEYIINAIAEWNEYYREQTINSTEVSDA